MRFHHSPALAAHIDCGEHGRYLLARLCPAGVVAKVAPSPMPECDAVVTVDVEGEGVQRCDVRVRWRGRYGRVYDRPRKRGGK